ncbi:hypothetical protein E2C01_099297 [Portunus trituberculatus]|uniref:Uncharacterized protein n=1 Tax=Portunus trituberculatus TaxID=210409 RepID=A0A5B7KGI4_PORTR|nr:hypothetical protein [Portunus trituberculatus]
MLGVREGRHFSPLVGGAAGWRRSGCAADGTHTCRHSASRDSLLQR